MRPRRWPPISWILLGAAALALVVAFLVFLYMHPATAAVLRDVLIIALALQLILLTTVAIFLVYRLILLVDWFQQEIQPILQRARETVDTVHGTSVFLGRRLARPTIEAASVAAGVTQALRTLIRLLRGRLM
ncbi:hypothetical protein [Thermoflexus sp.]|uniref:hypothetical protein n=1 Tax=Thermoflexus sp. TaxID=1969742 RepID=UPI0025F60C11|nr:hypothetical protein [Thermoflexus sp.]MDW8179647.1 hypothetical protein [Anaerolineae bacterium]MCS6964554.1 hypothetical protein [Thermoflexus sp.]MCS7350196.1 hypothetical protein [Thermoflexus sp.]MCX7689331.1 hypothetical protein [Thermoflexus sp.]MDW8185063.1 hypothetical protein [Anaerolineae bacterium]